MSPFGGVLICKLKLNVGEQKPQILGVWAFSSFSRKPSRDEIFYFDPEILKWDFSFHLKFYSVFKTNNKWERRLFLLLKWRWFSIIVAFSIYLHIWNMDLNIYWYIQGEISFMCTDIHMYTCTHTHSLVSSNSLTVALHQKLNCGNTRHIKMWSFQCLLALDPMILSLICKSADDIWLLESS